MVLFTIYGAEAENSISNKDMFKRSRLMAEIKQKNLSPNIAQLGSPQSIIISGQTDIQDYVNKAIERYKESGPDVMSRDYDPSKVRTLTPEDIQKRKTSIPAKVQNMLDNESQRSDDIVVYRAISGNMVFLFDLYSALVSLAQMKTSQAHRIDLSSIGETLIDFYNRTIEIPSAPSPESGGSSDHSPAFGAYGLAGSLSILDSFSAGEDAFGFWVSPKASMFEQLPPNLAQNIADMLSAPIEDVSKEMTELSQASDQLFDNTMMQIFMKPDIADNLTYPSRPYGARVFFVDETDNKIYTTIKSLIDSIKENRARQIKAFDINAFSKFFAACNTSSTLDVIEDPRKPWKPLEKDYKNKQIWSILWEEKFIEEARLSSQNKNDENQLLPYSKDPRYLISIAKISTYWGNSSSNKRTDDPPKEIPIIFLKAHEGKEMEKQLGFNNEGKIEMRRFKPDYNLEFPEPLKGKTFNDEIGFEAANKKYEEDIEEYKKLKIEYDQFIKKLDESAQDINKDNIRGYDRMSINKQKYEKVISTHMFYGEQYEPRTRQVRIFLGDQRLYNSDLVQTFFYYLKDPDKKELAEYHQKINVLAEKLYQDLLKKDFNERQTNQYYLFKNIQPPNPEEGWHPEDVRHAALAPLERYKKLVTTGNQYKDRFDKFVSDVEDPQNSNPIKKIGNITLYRPQGYNNYQVLFELQSIVQNLYENSPEFKPHTIGEYYVYGFTQLPNKISKFLVQYKGKNYAVATIGDTLPPNLDALITSIGQ